MTGWLASWPAPDVFGFCYLLLTEHGTAEDVEKIDEQLNAPIGQADDLHKEALLQGLGAVLGGR